MSLAILTIEVRGLEGPRIEDPDSCVIIVKVRTLWLYLKIRLSGGG